MAENYTYIVKCGDGTLYTGWTNDLTNRLLAHNAGTGAKYTRSRRPVVLVYQERFATKEEAIRTLTGQLGPDTAMLVKASHAMHFGWIVEQLKQAYD